ncbi:Tubby C-terminal domain-containing protein [Entamoeba marina]
MKIHHYGDYVVTTDHKTTSYTFCHNRGLSRKYKLLDINNEVVYTTSKIYSFSNSFDVYNALKQRVATVNIKNKQYHTIPREESPFDINISYRNPHNQILYAHFSPNEARHFFKDDIFMRSITPRPIGKRYYLQFSQPTNPSFKNFQLFFPQHSKDIVLFEFMRQNENYKVITHNFFTSLQTFVICASKSIEISRR